ncbi:hypothetical protein ACLB2K_040985 [Fragaria x ananassa]
MINLVSGDQCYLPLTNIVEHNADELVELVAEVLPPPTAASPKPEAGTDEIDAETMNMEQTEQNDGNIE